MVYRLSFALCLALSVACSTPVPPNPDPPNTAGSGINTAEPSVLANVANPGGTANVAISSAATRDSATAEAAARFAGLFHDLSEPDQYFFSDNLISNETSYLQPATALATRAPVGAAYVGVGPEQNFSYIALSKPKAAFLVDIRRANALLHLLYKAAFEQSPTRAEFLALLLSRPAPKLDETAGLDAIVRAIRSAPSTEADFVAASERLRKHIADYGLALSPSDWKVMERSHRTFFQRGLDVRFSLHDNNGRSYPTLESLLLQTSPTGTVGSFLASSDHYAVLRKMHQEHRIIPIVGDFAGNKALAGLATTMKREGLELGVFYTSNVEQYLLDPEKWHRWTRNVLAFPRASGAIFVRTYLDQGRPHPRQLKGHRSATVLQPISAFETHFANKASTDFFTLSTASLLE